MSNLMPLALRPLPLGAVRPRGWLANQLRIQADGLSGHVDEFWPSIRDSAWVGGAGDGWERGPCWLDGLIPLAILLSDERLLTKVRRWVDYILDHPHDDGWLGVRPDAGQPYEYWPRFLVLKCLAQWHDATGDERVIPVMLRLCRFVKDQLHKQPLSDWARSRWAEFVLSIHWLFERMPAESWLLELADLVRRQGLDWAHLAENYPYKEKQTHAMLEGYQARAGGVWMNDNFLASHGVNLAIAMKAGGVAWRQSHDERDRETPFKLMATLDELHGLPTGVFTCDEHVAGRHPSQGTELCTVVEYLFSLEVLMSILGHDERLAERWERIAFNALPATFKPDMWAHQYDQQVNQVVCRIAHERVYSNNFADANLYGLEPHYGCCLANFHQGWPKFAAHLWMSQSDGGLAALSYAPCRVETSIDGIAVQIDVSTEYPFGDTVEIRITCETPVQFPLHLRIPSWAVGASVSMGSQQAVHPAPGTMHRIDREWSGETKIRLNLPATIQTRPGFNDSITVTRGPMIYALNIGDEWRYLKGERPHADWEVFPTTSWNYAIELDRDHPEKSFTTHRQPVGGSPFSPEGAPLKLIAHGKCVPGWAIRHNAADAPPVSPVRTDEPIEELTLLPYGCTNLRVTELPHYFGP